MDKIKAPFSPEQVKLLNEYQEMGIMHPFTCGGQPMEFEDEDGKFTENSRDQCPNEGLLIATKQGWVCPCGKYTQDWAHDFMLDVEEMKNTPFGKLVTKYKNKKTDNEK